MFIYNRDKDVFIHTPTSYILDGTYLCITQNDEIRNKFYNVTGKVLDDYSIGMMRAKRYEEIVYF